MTDYKQLCAELLTGYEILLGDLRFDNRLAKRARAALAEPESREPTPSDEALMALAVAVFEDQFATDKDYARAVLARWGNHPGSPDSSTLQPAPVSERLPEPTDEPMIPDHYCGDDIRVYREGFHAGYKYAFQLIEKHSDV